MLFCSPSTGRTQQPESWHAHVTPDLDNWPARACCCGGVSGHQELNAFGLAVDVDFIPLGGLGEFGMNLMAVSTEQTTLVIDAGVMFAGPELPGVDLAHSRL